MQFHHLCLINNVYQNLAHPNPTPTVSSQLVSVSYDLLDNNNLPLNLRLVLNKRVFDRRTLLERFWDVRSSSTVGAN